MKKSFVLNAALAYMAFLFAVSCVDKDYSEHRTFLDVPATLTVPGDLESGQTVKATLDIVSTHSWSAALLGDPAPEWLTLEDVSGVNLSGAAMSLPLRMTFEDNATDPLADRRAQILVTIDGDSRTIDVTQEALVPRFVVDEPHTYENLAAITDMGSQEFRIRISTNNAWKAEILDLGWDTEYKNSVKDSTANYVIDKSEGLKSGYIKVTLYDNEVACKKNGALKISSAWDTSSSDDSDGGFDVESQFAPDTIWITQKAFAR